MGRNEDALLRAAGEHALASATRGGSCTHPDQSRGLVQRHNRRVISGVGASSPILLFFIGGGVALHERLVGCGTCSGCYRYFVQYPCHPERSEGSVPMLWRLLPIFCAIHLSS